MKITTDACIQGAWAIVAGDTHKVLDIGAGTGLLSLMLAQRSGQLHIDAVELDAEAATQCAENVAGSPWADRIRVIVGDVRTFSGGPYDMIITNPPFFQQSLLGNKENRNNARHTLSLGYDELLQAAARLLKEEGNLSVLLPQTEYLLWAEIALQQGWSEFARLSIRHTAGAGIKRVVGMWSRVSAAETVESSLVIKDQDQQYTPEFVALLSPFYLQL